MGWSFLRGGQAWIKIFSVFWGSVCFGLIIRNHAKLYEPFGSLNTSSFDRDKNRTRHVVEDEICVSIVGIILFGSLIWFFVILLDLLKETKRRKWIDIGLHLGAGVFLLMTAGLFTWTVFERRVDFSKFIPPADAKDPTGYKGDTSKLNKQFLKYGYFNLLFYKFDEPFDIVDSSVYGIATFPHRNDKDRFIECLVTGFCIVLYGILLIGIAALIFFKKWTKIIKTPKNTMLYYTPCLFRKRTGILRLVTVILGFLSVILIATSMAGPQARHYRPYKRIIFRDNHNVQEEFVLAMVAIFFVLSSAWLTIFVKVYMPEGTERRQIDRWFHIMGGIVLMISSVIWFVSISLRTFTISTWQSESNPLADARTRAGFQNIILLKVTMKHRQMVDLFEHKYDDEKFAHVMIAGSLILLNGGVYMYLGLLLLWIKYGRLRDIRWIHPSVEIEDQHLPQPPEQPLPEEQQPQPQPQQPEQPQEPQKQEQPQPPEQKTENEMAAAATEENPISKEAETA